MSELLASMDVILFHLIISHYYTTVSEEKGVEWNQFPDLALQA
jgi:hypothetical protein